MPIYPHPLLPGMPGVKESLDSQTESLRVGQTEETETVCSLKLWERVNRRRKVVGLEPLNKKKRSAKDLAEGLLEMREYWVKGENWNQVQPGDDPLLLRFMAKINYAMPRTVLARISYEGVALWRELRVPKMAIDTFYTVESGGGPNYTNFYQTKHRDATKHGVVLSRDKFQFTMDSGHGLVVGQIVDLMWRSATQNYQPRQGSRIGVTVDSVNGNVITIKNGRGDNLPGISTSCFFMIDPAQTITLHVWRRDPNPTCEGVAKVVDRMQYTATMRGFDRRSDRGILNELSTGDAPPYSAYTTIRDLNTVNQWDDEKISTQSPGSIVQLSEFNREAALSYSTFTGLNNGISLDIIMRASSGLNDDATGQGLMLQYGVGYTATRCIYVTGITWPGIIYGIPNPDVFTDDGTIFNLSSDFWIPLQSTVLSANINSSQTVIPVVSTAGMPNSNFPLLIGTDLVQVISKTTNTFTVSRFYYSNTSHSHPIGTVVQLNGPYDFPYLEGNVEDWGNHTTTAPYKDSLLIDFIRSHENGFSTIRKGDSYTINDIGSANIPTDIFTTSGTWTSPVLPIDLVDFPPPTTIPIWVECWGGGGGGGKTGGGGGGSYSKKALRVQPTTQFDINIGLGGAGNAIGAGANGGDTTFGPGDIVKAKGGKGGNAEASDAIGTGGQSSQGTGDVKYSGGSGAKEGGGGASAGSANTGLNAIKLIGADAPIAGAKGGTLSDGDSPGGGGASTFNGANGKIKITRNVSLNYLSSAFPYPYAAIPDWTPYTCLGANNSDPPGLVNTILIAGSSWVPLDTDTLTQGIAYIAGTGAGGFRSEVSDYSVPFLGGGVLMTPEWSSELNLSPVAAPYIRTALTNYVSNESIFLGELARSPKLNGHVDDYFVVTDLIPEVISAGIGVTPLVSQLSLGWTNILCEFDITAANIIVSQDITHAWKERIAGVTVSGRGVASFDFNETDWAGYDAEVWVWRRRLGQKTIKRVGEGVYTASVKQYQQWDSLYWTAGITLNSSKVDIEDVLITYQDVLATADSEVIVLEHDTSVVKWDNDTIAAGLPTLQSIDENVPTNFITSFADLIPGLVFSVSIDFTDYYIPFIKYNFNDSNTGHEDSDGYPPVLS